MVALDNGPSAHSISGVRSQASNSMVKSRGKGLILIYFSHFLENINTTSVGGYIGVKEGVTARE